MEVLLLLQLQLCLVLLAHLGELQHHRGAKSFDGFVRLGHFLILEWCSARYSSAMSTLKCKVHERSSVVYLLRQARLKLLLQLFLHCCRSCFMLQELRLVLFGLFIHCVVIVAEEDDIS